MLSKKLVLYIALITNVLFLVFLVIRSGSIRPAPHLYDLDSGAFFDSIYAIALTISILFVSAGLGRILIHPFKLTKWTFIERTSVGLPLGLVTIGYGEFLLGLLGFLKPIHHILLISLVCIVVFKNSVCFITEGLLSLKQFLGKISSQESYKKWLLILASLILLITFLHTLTPPYDYDGLMYHLQGPRLFLEEGQIQQNNENWLTNYPFIWEMLYMFGMGLGSDIFSRVLHFSTLILLILTTYSIGNRFLNEQGGWLSVAILLGTPQLLVWSIFSYVDIGWTLVQTITVFIFLVWHRERKYSYLIMAGLFQGISLSTKYLAFGTFLIILIIIAWVKMREKTTSSLLFREMVIDILIFGTSAFMIAAPWYFKNLIWTGNPVFPYYLSQEILNSTELDILMDYTRSYGTGHNLMDYILLPINLYIRYPDFSTFWPYFDFPHPLFLLSILYLVVRKFIPRTKRASLDLITILISFQFAIWAIGMQQTRFLTPIYPLLSILTGAIILHIPHLTNKFSKVLTCVSVGGMMFISLLVMSIFYYLYKPFNVTLGIQSKSDFLNAVVSDYSGINYINSSLPKDSKVFMPWNGRSYYCNGICYPDISQAKWSSLIKERSNSIEVMKWLKENNITHILLSISDANFFVNLHDQNQIHKNAFEFLKIEFIPSCTTEIFSDEKVEIYEINNICK